MNIIETPWGYELKTDEVTVLFGGMKAQTVDLRKAFPNIQFTRLKQIHSDAILKTDRTTPDYELLGDAHWTQESNLALGIITADCVPVFLFDSKTKLVAGIHAGWRGVASKIIPKTIEKLVRHSSDPRNLQVFIGPHIQKDSFEVGKDVRDQILSSLGPLSPDERRDFFTEISADKVLLDLHKVVMTQLAQAEIPEANTHSLYIDTVKDLRFHSHRRDKDKAGRQLSFICKNP